MPHMQLIVEPLGQRAERGREAGEAVYQRMVDFSAELQAAGLLLGVNSLGTAATRLSKRDGGIQVWDGPWKWWAATFCSTPKTPPWLGPCAWCARPAGLRIDAP